MTWFYDALDVITPSVYLGVLQNETTSANTSIYVKSTINEAIRLTNNLQVSKPIFAITWMFYDNYWQIPPPAPRTSLTGNDLAIELEAPLSLGIDGLLLWGSITNDDTSDMNVTAVQQYTNTVLAPIVSQICFNFSCL